MRLGPKSEGKHRASNVWPQAYCAIDPHTDFQARKHVSDIQARTARAHCALFRTSGRRVAGSVSPKLSLAFAPTKGSELYVSGGFGFHSNDARGTTITIDPTNGDSVSRVDPLVRSKGGEVGLRVTPVTGLRSTASVWFLNLDSELLA